MQSLLRRNGRYRLLSALLCATFAVSVRADDAPDAGPILAFSAGTTQRQRIILPASASHHALPVVALIRGPSTVRARAVGFTSHDHGVRVQIVCPAQLAPGLYPLTLKVSSSSGTAQHVHLQLAVEAIYIGRNAQGVLVESPTGTVLSRWSQAITNQLPENGGMGTSAISYDPDNENLYIYAGGVAYRMTVTTTSGQPVSIPFKRPSISHINPQFIAWLGEHQLAFAGSQVGTFSDQGVALMSLPYALPPRGFHGVGSMTADPRTGNLYLSYGTAQHHRRAGVYVFNRSGREITRWPVAPAIKSLTFNPWNGDIYAFVWRSETGNGNPAIEAFTPQGVRVSLSGAFPGVTVRTPVLSSTLTANPVNGHLYYLTDARILVYSPQGQLLRTLPRPTDAKDITFVPGFLTPPQASRSGLGPAIATAQEPIPEPPRTDSAASGSTQCPPGYRCIPKTVVSPATGSAGPSASSMSHGINHVTDSVDNTNNMANSVSNLINIFR